MQRKNKYGLPLFFMSVWIGQAWCHIGPYAKFSWSFATDDWPLGQDVNPIGPDLKPTFASNSIQFDKLLRYLHVRGKLAYFNSAGWRSEKLGVKKNLLTAISFLSSIEPSQYLNGWPSWYILSRCCWKLNFCKFREIVFIGMFKYPRLP